MGLVVRTIDMADLEQLKALVIEHLDDIEPGVRVLDSRLLLGHATIDIVGADREGTIVFVIVGLTADEDMMLRAMEACSWCLEYPETMRRFYSSADLSLVRPPRLLFVVGHMPESFLRKIKQLGVPAVECIEFRAVDVAGTPAIYLHSIARLVRGGAMPKEIADASP